MNALADAGYLQSAWTFAQQQPEDHHRLQALFQIGQCATGIERITLLTKVFTALWAHKVRPYPDGDIPLISEICGKREEIVQLLRECTDLDEVSAAELLDWPPTGHEQTERSSENIEFAEVWLRHHLLSEEHQLAANDRNAILASLAMSLPRVNYRGVVCAWLVPFIAPEWRPALIDTAIAAGLSREYSWATPWEGPFSRQSLSFMSIEQLRRIVGSFERATQIEGHRIIVAALALQCLDDAREWLWLVTEPMRSILERLIKVLPDPSEADLIAIIDQFTIDISPYRFSERLEVLVPYIIRLPLKEQQGLWQRLIGSFELSYRWAVFAQIGALAPLIASLGGAAALTMTFEVVEQSARWFP